MHECPYSRLQFMMVNINYIQNWWIPTGDYKYASRSYACQYFAYTRPAIPANINIGILYCVYYNSLGLLKKVIYEKPLKFQ